MKKESAKIIIKKEEDRYICERIPEEYFTGNMATEAGKIEKLVKGCMDIFGQKRITINFYG